MAPLHRRPPRLSCAPVRRLEVIGLIVVLLAGAALRLPGLGARALWLDETFTLESARAPDLGAMLELLRAQIAAPLYPLLARGALALEGWLGLEAALRLPSALAGCASPAVLFAVVRARAGPRAALVAAAALALHPGQVVMSQEARTYALEVLLAALLLLQADRVAARWRLRDAALLGAVGAALVVCHVLGGALFLAVALALAVTRGRVAWPAVGVATLTAGVLVAPVLPLLLGIGDRMLVDAAAPVAVGLRTVEGVARELAGVNVALRSRLAVAALWPLALLGAVAAVRARRADEALVPALGLLLPLIAFALAPPVALYTRYFVFLLPSALLLAARGVALLTRVGGRGAGAAASALLLGALVHALAEARATPDVPYRALGAWLDARVREGERVVVHAHREEQPVLEGERRLLALYASPRVQAALVDLHGDLPDAPLHAVVLLRPRHALPEGATVEGAEVLGPRLVVVPPSPGDRTAADAVRRLADVDRRLPGHDEDDWRAVFGRWLQ